jgi:glycopeptide antibiotics resistance protein
MMVILVRFTLVCLPILYMILIWLQSRYFSPDSVLDDLSYIGHGLIIILGTGFELLHFFEFALLYLFIILTFLSFGELTKRKEYLAIIISFLFSVGDEIHQYFVPFRSSTFTDLLKNLMGIIVVWRVTHWFYFKVDNSLLVRFRRKMNPKSNGKVK